MRSDYGNGLRFSIMVDDRRRPAWVWLGLLLATAGCLPRNSSVDLLHARLRQNEDQLAELQAAFNSSQSQLTTARREIDALRTEIAESGQSNMSPEQTAAMVQVTNIDVQPWLTGGIDQDNAPGDDALVVHFMPRDADGETVKLPGDVKIRLTDPGASAGEETVGTWTFTPEQCRDGWTRGLLGGGYQFTLPWQDSPRHSRLAVHVEYQTPDGRSFTDTKLVKVHPAPESLAERMQPRIQTAGASFPADTADESPQPRRKSQTLQRPVYRAAGMSERKSAVEQGVAKPTTAPKTRGVPQTRGPAPSIDDDDAAVSEDRPQLPHSANWTEDTMPQFR